MCFPRPAWQVARRSSLPLLLILLASLSLTVWAQTPAEQTPAPSVPAPTTAPASSLPAVPGTAQQQTPPAAGPNSQAEPSQAAPDQSPASEAPYTQTPAAQTPAQSVPDPLEQPIAVPPAPTTPQTQIAPATPGKMGPSIPAYDLETSTHTDALGSTYIPVDSWVYTEVLRLYSLGYIDTAFINMRPWTRRSLLHMLQASSDDIMSDGNDQAVEILAKLNDYLTAETPAAIYSRGAVYGLETAYTRMLGIDGQTLRDSYHLGQTIANDYGRPYEPGFNNITGFSTVNEVGRFSLYLRGEYQHAPSGGGYSQALTSFLSNLDEIPYPGVGNYNAHQATIPTGPIAGQNPFALQEATLSFHLLGHEISGGKSDSWDGPAYGSAMDWSNNAEDIYSFRINRVEPWHIPLVSWLLGPVRYDFFFGSLKGHTDPNSPYVHSEMFSFAPTKNFQFAFQRSVIWGGEGHEPVTLHTFFRSFFSVDDTTGPEKSSAQDPGARYSDFSFSWRLPFISHSVTLYTDSICHDDVSPISAPRRAAYRPGVYISQIPGLHKLDFRVEAASTDTSTLRSLNGQFNYYEIIQKQGYTNKGFIMGDWIGREAKGGQAWLTYHLSGNEWIQLQYLDKKTPKDFIPGGTTQGQFKIDAVKRLSQDIELNAWVQYERWKAPIYINNPNDGPNNDTAIAAQLTWYPKLHTDTGPAR